MFDSSDHSLEKLTRKWLSHCITDPAESLPPGWEYKFGIRGKFVQHESLEALESAHMEADSPGVKKPFAYCLPSWPEIRANLNEKMLPGDEIWEVDQNLRKERFCGGTQIVFIARDGELITREYPSVKKFYGTTAVRIPDPDFFFDLACL